MSQLKRNAVFVILVSLTTIIGFIYFLPGQSVTKLDSLYVTPLLDFGHVKAQKISGKLELKNLTDAPITVTRIDSSCGCTTASLDLPLTLSPDQKVLCTVVFDGKGRSGPIRKRLIFHTDSLEESEGALKNIAMVAEINAYVETSKTPTALPSVLNFSRFGSWESPIQKIAIVNQGSVPLKILDLKSCRKDLSVEIIDLPNGSKRLLITAKKEGDLGIINCSQTVYTSQGVVKFDIRGERFGKVFMDSSVLTFRVGEDSPLTTEPKILKIHHHPEIDPTAIKVAVDGWSVESDILNRVSRTETELRIRFVRESDTEGSLTGTLAINAGDISDSFSADYVMINSNNNFKSGK